MKNKNQKNQSILFYDIMIKLAGTVAAYTWIALSELPGMMKAMLLFICNAIARTNDKKRKKMD